MWKKEMFCDEFMLFVCFVVIFYVTIYLNLSDIIEPQWKETKVVNVHIYLSLYKKVKVKTVIRLQLSDNSHQCNISFLDMIDLDDVVPSFYSVIVLLTSGNSWKLWDKDDKTLLFFVDFWRNNKIGQTIFLKVS